MRLSLFFLAAIGIVAALVLPHTQSIAQKRDSKFDVGVDQLAPEDMPERPDSSKKVKEGDGAGATDSSFGLAPRSQQEVEQVVRQLSGSLQSGCCPHKRMNDITCPCHDVQERMLIFLARKGFSIEQLRSLLVRGVNPSSLIDAGVAASVSAEDLSNEYRLWLSKEFNYHGGALEQHFALMTERGQEMGWNKGWSELILQAPQRKLPWALIVIAALATLAIFAFGVNLVRRNRGGVGATRDTRSEADEVASAVRDARREALRKEAQALEDQA